MVVPPCQIDRIVAEWGGYLEAMAKEYIVEVARIEGSDPKAALAALEAKKTSGSGAKGLWLDKEKQEQLVRAVSTTGERCCCDCSSGGGNLGRGNDGNVDSDGDNRGGGNDVRWYGNRFTLHPSCRHQRPSHPRLPPQVRMLAPDPPLQIQQRAPLALRQRPERRT